MRLAEKLNPGPRTSSLQSSDRTRGHLGRGNVAPRREPVDQACWRHNSGKLSTRRTIGIKFLQKWNKGKLLNSCSLEEVFCFCPAIAPIVAEIFGEETEAAQWIVPPVVEIHDGASSRLERIRDGCQQGEIVSFPPNKGVQAEKAIKEPWKGGAK